MMNNPAAEATPSPTVGVSNSRRLMGPRAVLVGPFQEPNLFRFVVRAGGEELLLWDSRFRFDIPHFTGERRNAHAIVEPVGEHAVSGTPHVGSEVLVG